MHRLTAALLLAAGTYVCPIAAGPIALQTGATPLAPPAFEKRQTVRCASTTDCKTVGYHGPSTSHFGCNKKRGLCIWECNAGYQLVGGACEQTCDVTAVCTNDVPVNANRYCRRGLCEWLWRPLSRSFHFCDVHRFIFVHIVSHHNALDHNFRSDTSTDRLPDWLPLASAAPTQPAATPILRRAYQGASFFDGWKFWNDTDPTQGQVVYVDRTYAVEKSLAYVREDGVAVLSIDKSSALARGEGRASVRISSIEDYEPGSLILVDLAHAPYGPSVWPAFWTYADPWPDLAEIDIYEGINSRTWNQYNIHTTAGCYRNDSVPQTGSRSTSRTHCLANGSGCAVQDYNPESYGKGFNEAGGGVFAVLFAETRISIWRWTRATIPPDVASGEPRWQNWGIPVAAWQGSMCDIKKYFRSQMLTFDITTCGTWAGQTAIWFNSHSSGDTSAYADCVAAVQDPAAFAEAHFEINYVKVYNV
ncbi:uncharacterized protein JCM10292_003060 [Rhodotorula paludigena]|uniref:uncharacterized protein n=1 Tax=Rhodotorula paludigena TaxID=86838 RepID=UPI00316AF6FF